MFPLKDDIPTRRFPILTLLLIVANVLMFFVFQGAYFNDADFDKKVVEYGAIPYEITHPGDHCDVTADGSQLICEGQPGVTGEAPDQPPTWLTILTSMFMHGGLLHLGGQHAVPVDLRQQHRGLHGQARFVLFYLLGGLVAVFAQTVIEPNAAVPTIGASGAVAAVLGGYALLYPRARVVTLLFIIIFFTIVELPALLVLGVWFVLQALYGASEVATPAAGGGGVAYFAHIGGFLFGLAAIKLFADRVHEDYERAHRTPVY